VIPSYNEGATVISVIRLVLAQSEVQEVVVVDDGSQDQTWEMLQLCVENPRVIALRHSQNCGKGAALRTGFAKTSADIVHVVARLLTSDGRGRKGCRSHVLI
jgi:glucosyl-3-phosphoglycerate synthase